MRARRSGACGRLHGDQIHNRNSEKRLEFKEMAPNTSDSSGPPCPNVNVPLRLGIVGCGAITQQAHLPTVLTRGDVNVTILCDKNLARAVGLKGHFCLNSLVSSELSDVIANSDIAVVAVPPRFHRSVCCSLLEKGLDVLCEKPLASSPEEAREMVAVAERAGRLLGVGFQNRFLDGNSLMAAVLHEGLIGELREIKCEFGSKQGWPMSGGDYYNAATTRGGALFDQGIHILDRVTALFGPIEVLHFEDDSFGGVECNAFLTGRVSVGGVPIPCSMRFSWTHSLPDEIVLTGSRGTAITGRSWPESVLIRTIAMGRPAESMMSWSGKPVHQTDKSGSHRLWADFLDAVRTRRAPLTDGRASIQLLETIERAYAIRSPMLQPWVMP